MPDLYIVVSVNVLMEFHALAIIKLIPFGEGTGSCSVSLISSSMPAIEITKLVA